MRFAYLLVVLFASVHARAEEPGLIGHWPLSGDARDVSGRGNHGRSVSVDFATPSQAGKPGVSARFDGKASMIEIPANSAPALGTKDFTLAVWARTEAVFDDLPGDLVSQYDPIARKGFNWSLKSGPGTTNSQSNDRNLQFGIDSGTPPVWSDRGRPGNAVYIMAMAVHNGELYVGICEAGPNNTGHVYVYQGGTRWVDCGSPDSCNAVTSLASFNGKLYAGTGKYRLAGSALPESTNANLGGAILSYETNGRWTECGRLPDTEAIGGLVAFRGDLYASSLYRPAGFFRYRKGKDWQRMPLPEDGRRVVSLGVFNGYIYAGSYDSCSVSRFDGTKWETFPVLESSGQTYSFEAYAGELYVGTWPNGQVFRLDQDDHWVSAGRLGEEKEVMGMAVHNGKLYGGTLPLAEVYRLDQGTRWTSTGRVDLTPDVRYRRAWSMAVFNGSLFCGTLPSGHVQALRVGRNVSLDRPLEPGWRHLAAVRAKGRLMLYVDGSLAASSPSEDAEEPPPLDLTNGMPLRIGFGPTDHFLGNLSDLRLYDRALSDNEIAALAKPGG